MRREPRFSTLALIPARGGSKELTGKNLRELGGKPLLAHSIQAALDARGVDRVVVSTDCPEIRRQAVLHGAEAPFLRPDRMAGDASPLGEALNHALAWFSEDGWVPTALLVLLPTHPFRPPGLLDKAVDTLRAGHEEFITTRRASPGPHGLFVLDRDDKPRRIWQDEAGLPMLRNYGLVHGLRRDGLADRGVHLEYVDDPVMLMDIDRLEDFVVAQRLLSRKLWSRAGCD